MTNMMAFKGVLNLGLIEKNVGEKGKALSRARLQAKRDAAVVTPIVIK